MSPPPSRRRLLAGVATASVAGLAGCLGGAIDDATTHEAAPATVAESSIEEAGYGLEESHEVVEEETVAGQSVEFRNQYVEYARSGDLPGIGEVTAGVFTTVTSPRASVLGRELNPIAEMGPEEIAAYADEQYPELSVRGEPVGERSVESLEATTVTTFSGTVTIEGYEVDALIDVTRLAHEGDHVVAVGVYPEALPGSAGRIETMFEGLDH
ncbi:DUF6517 family protein [Saliphagus infecundisoli]|uniref:DUF6517 family protein n=1 Tax=Saliphagus infecundisoli TaxID=1849069 RepID=A0ABD5QA14_9EURY|nr:DUF6517 family protein [Saliphagus infecundisoli]